MREKDSNIVMRLTIADYPDKEHIFLSERKLYYYKPGGDGKIPTWDIGDFWIEEERGGPNFRVTIGNEILIGPSETRYYLRVKFQGKGKQQPLPGKYRIKGYRIPGDEDRHLGITDLFPSVKLWLLPLPFETGTRSLVCHRLDPERVDRKTGKPYVYDVYEPTCQYCHNWLLPGDPHSRPMGRTVDAYFNIAPGQKYCSPECRYKAQLDRQKYRYNYSRGNIKKIAPDGWINIRDHIEAGCPAISRTSIDDLPRCDNCGGILQRKRMKRSAGKGQYCSDRCRKAYKRRGDGGFPGASGKSINSPSLRPSSP